MSLFDGTYGFVPAFKGRELAIEEGQAASQAVARGFQINQGQQQQDLERDKFNFMKQKYGEEMSFMKKYGDKLNSFFGGSGTGSGQSDQSLDNFDNWSQGFHQ